MPQAFEVSYVAQKGNSVEVKGYETDRDRAKWLHFPKKLCIIKEKEIKEIRKGCFVSLQHRGSAANS